MAGKKDALETYRAKRSFTQTKEPRGGHLETHDPFIFVIQKHAASRLHYDFRFNLDGVLKSWAIPKGFDFKEKGVKRLAVQTEDHPIEYADFEGEIPPGNYGAGTVTIFDRGIFEPVVKEGEAPLEAVRHGLEKGHLRFILRGHLHQGEYSLIRTKAGKKGQWLLLQHRSFAAGKAAASEPMPWPIRPMLSESTEEPFSRDDWLFEYKWDGYRALARIVNGEVTLLSRNGISLNDRFAAVVPSLATLPGTLILDGEVVAFAANGLPSFQELQHPTSDTKLMYVAFDCLYAQGHNLLSLPLRSRRDVLEKIVGDGDGTLCVSPAIWNDGMDAFAAAKKFDLEGMMAKDGEAAYIPGMRTRQWLKVKSHLTQETVIIAYVLRQKHLRAFLMGIYEEGKLRYAGRVGSGISPQQSQDLLKVLVPLRIEKPTVALPKDAVSRRDEEVCFVRPTAVAQVRFYEWTRDGRMRHPVFLGLRDDKTALEVEKETRQPVAENVTITHPDRIYFPEEKLTKADVAAYYREVEEFIMPQLRARPQSLNRFPEGIHKSSFFQKNLRERLPSWVETVMITSHHDADKQTKYLVCKDAAHLMFMVNRGCIEINPWASRVGYLDTPDYVVLDLDPEAVPFTAVVKVAQAVRDVLDDLELHGFLKTSGKRGLHVYIPLQSRYPYNSAFAFSELLARLVHARVPELSSLERSPAKRQGKVFLDYFRNTRGQTTCSAYSLRPVPLATISTPLHWKELTARLNPASFTIAKLRRRLNALGDIWETFFLNANPIEEALKRLTEMQSCEFKVA